MRVERAEQVINNYHKRKGKVGEFGFTEYAMARKVLEEKGGYGWTLKYENSQRPVVDTGKLVKEIKDFLGVLHE